MKAGDSRSWRSRPPGSPSSSRASPASATSELRAKTAEFRQRHANGELLDDLLFEAFAVAREAAKRALGMRPFDVQVLGGIVLHDGDIAEMKTGEGKTLVATMPMYLNALAGNGTHLVTVNDYLAKRDAEWMGEVYRFLGLDVGVIQANMTPEERRAQYNADVTYGTNSEFGFDYLRDNMTMRREHMVQRGHAYCIVDEVDSILIDEARTPLIISGAPETAADTYRQFARIVPRLHPGEDYEVDEKQRTVAVTESGVAKVERALDIENLYKDSNGGLVNHLIQALRAEAMYHKDVEYVVQNGEVLIVDEFTGRILDGRRYSEGLHQAIEAKEKVPIREENQTLATITLQNYFRMYDVLAGMTGTAKTEEDEFRQIYGLEVVQIPTNAPMVRNDENDFIFTTAKEKFAAVTEDIVERYEKGQPVLVGTVSVEVSEMLSRQLERHGVPHNVLNAKQHEREAEIIKDAGQTGVDHDRHQHGRPRRGHQARRRRHRSRRPLRARHRAPREPPHRQPAPRPFRPPGRPRRDALLPVGRGRAHPPVRRRPHVPRPQPPGAQGGRASRGQDAEQHRRARAGQGRGAQLHAPQERAQVRRGHERAAPGRLRPAAAHPHGRGLRRADPRDDRRDWWTAVVRAALADAQFSEEWDLDSLFIGLKQLYDPTVKKSDVDVGSATVEEVVDLVLDDALAQYDERERLIGEEQMRSVERAVMLQVIDSRWKDHLLDMDYLQEGIHLRALGQRDPLVEYKNEGFELFQDMMDGIKTSTVTTLMKNAPEDLAVFTAVTLEEPVMALNYTSGDDLITQTSFTGAAMAAGEYGAAEDGLADAPPPNVAAGGGRRGATSSTGGGSGTGTGTVTVQQRIVYDKVGRNDPCPCGSGKKYKKCHGA